MCQHIFVEVSMTISSEVLELLHEDTDGEAIMRINTPHTTIP
jgi:hypothetical protein